MLVYINCAQILHELIYIITVLAVETNIHANYTFNFNVVLLKAK